MDPEKKDDLGRQQQQQQTEVYSLSDTSESDDKAIDVKTDQISHSQQPPATLNGHHAHGSSQGPSGGLSEESLAALSRHTTEASHVSSDGQHADVEGDFRGASMSRARTGTSFGSTASRMPEHEVTFDEGSSSSSSSDGDEDKSSSNSDNPRDWPLWYRGWVLFCIAFSTWVVVLYSTSYTASIPGLMLEFDVADQTIATLGVTSYLVGLAVGSLVLAPLSELYGRRPVYLVCMACFTVLVIPTGLATSLVEIIVVRFFGYVFFFLPLVVFRLHLHRRPPQPCQAILNKTLNPLQSRLWRRHDLQQPRHGGGHIDRTVPGAVHVALLHRALQRAGDGAPDRRLHIPGLRLALGQLAGADLGRRGLWAHVHRPRDLRARHTSGQGEAQEKGDGRR